MRSSVRNAQGVVSPVSESSLNPQQPTNVGACSWIRSVGWRLDLPRQKRICRFVIRQLIMRRGFLLSTRRSATSCGQCGLVGCFFTCIQQRSWGSNPFAGLLLPSRRLDVSVVRWPACRSQAFPPDRFRRAHAKRAMEIPVRASGRDTSWAIREFAHAAKVRVPALGFFLSQGFGRAWNSRTIVSSSRTAKLRWSSVPVLDFSSTIRSWVCGALPAQMCQTSPAASTCTELFSSSGVAGPSASSRG